MAPRRCSGLACHERAKRVEWHTQRDENPNFCHLSLLVGVAANGTQKSYDFQALSASDAENQGKN